MNTAVEYFDKTAARPFGANSTGFANFQKKYNSAVKKATETYNKNNVTMQGKLDDAAKTLADTAGKTKKEMEALGKSVPKKALAYGAVGGVVGTTATNYATSKDEEI